LEDFLDLSVVNPLYAGFASMPSPTSGTSFDLPARSRAGTAEPYEFLAGSSPVASSADTEELGEDFVAGLAALMAPSEAGDI
jgi:hypothetical protein